MKRSLLAPEVVQTSAMDCGPAALKCLLGGFGIEASYGRLREACQTDVDGTSIDTLEAIANSLGLDVSQTMLPIDWLLLPEAEALPCLVVVQVPGGGNHFLVVWRRFGPWLQLMDPASGRRWVRCRDFENEIYRHRQPLPATMLRGWMASDTPLAVLKSRLAALGLTAEASQGLLDRALADPSCRGLAALDAARRLAELLQTRRALQRGEPTRALLAALLDEPDRIPARLFAIEEDPSTENAPDADKTAFLRGAVFLKVAGLRPEGAAADLPVELRAALTEPKAEPARLLWDLLRQGGLTPILTLGAALLLSAACGLVLALALRGLVDLRGELPLTSQRLAAISAVLALAGGLLLVEAPAVAALLQAARGLELRLRLRFAEKVPRLADRYFRSRPRSDMAQRAHVLHHIRKLPATVFRCLRAGLGLLAAAAGIVWIDPAAWLPALLALAIALFLPLLALPGLNEQDLKLRGHAGALTRFNLDALLGLHALRAHGAQAAVARAHRQLLGEWATAAGRFESVAIRVELAQLTLLFGLAVWLVAAHLARGNLGSGSLLLAFWALLLPSLALELARAAWTLPSLRSLTLRLLEPLGALEEAPQNDAEGTADENAAGPCGFVFDNVTVKAAGHTVLDGLQLEIAAGEHVAVVGPSGAGKSSLLGLLLGWHRPSTGRVLIDGEPLDEQRLARLRHATAWIDPEVQLWQASCLDNLLYGAEDDALAEIGRVLRQAELESVIEKSPDGLATALGENGARFSGGEGQRVRIGRALLKKEARLVLLDEPFRGLTRESRDRLLGRLRELYRGTTLIYVSHDVEHAQNFDRVVVIENGNVAEDGTPAELLARPGGRLRELSAKEGALRRRLEDPAAWRPLRLHQGRVVAAKAHEEEA